MKKYHLSILLCSSLLTLVACGTAGSGGTYKPSMFESTTATQRSITLQSQRYVETLDVNDLSFSYLGDIARDYKRHGSSPIYAVLSYDPNIKNGKLTAFNQSNVVKGQLAKLGVTNAVVKTMPVTDASNNIVIGYDRTTAHGPENCGKMPGYNSETGVQDNYGLGCTVKDMIAKQVAYSNDLAGQSDMTAFEAGRAAAAVNRDARSGEISDFVPNYILSEVGQ
jgi:hypothetical protein